MEIVSASEEFRAMGFSGAVKITENDVKRFPCGAIKNAHEILEFARTGESMESIIDEGEGKLVLVQLPNGLQYTLPVIEFDDALDDLLPQ